MRTISLLFFCFVALFSQAQDRIVGGQSKSSATSEKYDSLSNFYSDNKDKSKMIGQEFTYYNMFNYASLENESQGFYQVPYPWKDGRIRSGRYISSQTAKDEYLTTLKRKSGTKYKLIKFVSYDNKPGIVFSDAKGDSIYYPDYDWMVKSEFICEGFKEKFRKEYVGKNIYYAILRGNNRFHNSLSIRNCYVELKSREIKPSLPYMSLWNIKGISVDTTYWEKDNHNQFCRLTFIMHNDELGDYECDVEYSDLMDYLKNPRSKDYKFLPEESIIGKPFNWGDGISTSKWEEDDLIPDDILSSAKENNPQSIYAIIDYCGGFRNFSRGKNLDYEEMITMLNHALEKGFVHPYSGQYLYDIAIYYLDEDINKALSFLKRSIKLGYESSGHSTLRSSTKRAEKLLIDLVKSGIIDFKENSDILINAAENENEEAILFLGDELSNGRIKEKKVITWLEKLAKKNDDSCFILYQCYLNGMGVSKDMEKALEMLIKAADRWNQKACLELGMRYFEGRGIDKDWEKAKPYLERGTDGGKSNNETTNIEFRHYFALGKIFELESDIKCLSYYHKAFYYSSNPQRYEAALALGKVLYKGFDIDGIIVREEGKAAEYFWIAYKEGNLEEGKILFEKYQLKDTLIEYLRDEESKGNRRNNYVEDIIKSLGSSQNSVDLALKRLQNVRNNL